MDESRIELTERLRREGRWEEACVYRDRQRKLFKAEGKTRSEANEAAWRAMSEKFPPLKTESAAREPSSAHDPDNELLIAALAEKTKDTKTDLVRDTLWAYEQLANSAASPADAPSPGAWSLLRWARENQDKFFVMVSKAMSQVSKQNEETEERCDSGIEDIGLMLEEFNVSFRASLRQEILSNDSEFARNRSRSLLQDWRQEYDITLPDDACEGLTAKVVELLDQCRCIG